MAGSFLYGLGAFGSGFMPGLGAGLDLYDKYTDIQGQAGAVELLKKMGMDQQALPLGQGPGALAQPGMTPPTGRLPGASLSPSLGQSDEATGAPGSISSPRMLGTPDQGAAMAAFGGPGPLTGVPPGGMAGGMPFQRTALPQPPAGTTAVPTTSFRPGGPAGGAPTGIPAAPVRPQPAQQQVPDRPPQQPIPSGTPEQIAQFQMTGQGWLTQQGLAQRIDAAMPGASPMAKFKAMQAAAKLMNTGGKEQFSETMRLLEFQQKQKLQDQKLEHDRLMEQHRTTREDQAETRLLRQDAYYKDQQKSYMAAGQNLTNTQLRMEKIHGHLLELSKVADKVAVTGNPTIDTWLAAARAKLGWGAEEVFKYKAMLTNVQSEIAAMSQQTLGALTVSAREDAKLLAGGVLSPSLWKSIEEAVKIEGKVTKEATERIRKRHLDNMNYFMRTKGQIRPEEPEPPEPAPSTVPAGGATGSDPMGLFK